MKKVLVLGAFGYFCNQLDGQTIKTRNVYNLLHERYAGKVWRADTLKLKKNPLLLLDLLWKLIKCNTLIIIPCLNNLTYIFPVVYYLSKIFGYEIIHICIGGWQVEYFKGDERFASHPFQLSLSKKIKAFMPEMEKVDNDLKLEFGFNNTVVLTNFREIDISIVNRNNTRTLKLVFLSRINKKKGYPTVFNFAQYVRENGLDITITFYGMVESDDKEDFMFCVSQFPDIVTYGGLLSQEIISRTLVNYDLMLFPTRYYTEGLPGTIIDAYIANLPVIATEWKHAREFIKDGETGFIVRFDNCQKEFDARIMELYNNRKKLSVMKCNDKKEALRFTETNGWQVLSKYL